MKKVFINFWNQLKKRNANRSDSKKLNAGFSFIETLAVLAVTAVLATQAGAMTFKMIEKARVSSARNQIESFKIALQSYYIDCGSFPTTEQGLKALWEKPEYYPVPENWNGPYTDKKIPNDPWGKAYVYKKNGEVYPEGAPENAPFIILSFGSDGVQGGEKSAIDIVSWE